MAATLRSLQCILLYILPLYGNHLLNAASGHFCAKKAKMNLLSRAQLFFSARYKKMSAIVKKEKRKMFVLLQPIGLITSDPVKVVGRLARVKYR